MAILQNTTALLLVAAVLGASGQLLIERQAERRIRSKFSDPSLPTLAEGRIGNGVELSVNEGRLYITGLSRVKRQGEEFLGNRTVFINFTSSEATLIGSQYNCTRGEIRQHRTDCRKYVRCADWFGTKTVIVDHSIQCPAKQIFDPVWGMCVAMSENLLRFYCTDTITNLLTREFQIPPALPGRAIIMNNYTIGGLSSQFPCLRKNYYYGHPGDTSLFYSCSLRSDDVAVFVAFSCPDGHAFTETSQMCVDTTASIDIFSTESSPGPVTPKPTPAPTVPTDSTRPSSPPTRPIWPSTPKPTRRTTTSTRPSRPTRPTRPTWISSLRTTDDVLIFQGRKKRDEMTGNRYNYHSHNHRQCKQQFPEPQRQSSLSGYQQSRRPARPPSRTSQRPRPTRPQRPEFPVTTQSEISLPSSRPDFQETLVPDFQETLSPVSQEGSRPSFQEGSRPSFQEGSRPSFQESSRPSFLESSSSDFDETLSPAFLEDSSPALRETSSPAFRETSSPAFQETSNPAFQETSNPAFQETSNPAFQETFLPEFQETSSLSSPTSSADVVQRPAQRCPHPFSAVPGFCNVFSQCYIVPERRAVLHEFICPPGFKIASNEKVCREEVRCSGQSRDPAAIQ